MGSGPCPVARIIQPAGAEVRLVDSPQALASLVGTLAETRGPIGVDLETTGLDPRKHRVRLIAIAMKNGVFVVDVAKVLAGDLLAVLDRKYLVFHHAAFDLSFLRRYRSMFGTSVFDTMLASQVLDAGLRLEKGRHSLASVSERFLGVRLDKSLQTSDWSGLLSENQIRYAGSDAAVLLPLHARLLEELQDADLLETMELESRCLPGVVAMAGVGVPFDERRWLCRFEEDRSACEVARNRLETRTGRNVNWNSALQTKEYFRGLGIELADTRRDTLARLAHPSARALVEYKTLSSAVTRYGPGFATVVDGRLFPSWHQLGAASGRMSCSEPNMQALPRDPRYRSCIRARAGFALVSTDLSQIELRIAAKISGDTRLREAFLHGNDLHVLTARSILGVKEITKEQRQLAKALNFGLLYGMGAKSLQEHTRTEYGIDLNERQAEAYRERFFRTYPGLRRWQREVGDTTHSETRTLGGRRRLVTAETSYTQILNTPVQGTGADGIKQALALLWERREECPEASLVLAIHDELVVEVPIPKAERAKEWLESALRDGMGPLISPVPVEVETTVRAAEAE